MNKKGNPQFHRHGMYGTPTYRTWCSMKSRCKDINSPSYGGRGISVCERWQEFSNFFADMGVRPDGLSLDRIDNDGNYTPENCRWATSTMQNRNKRNIKKYKGKSVPEWAEELGIGRTTLYSRLYDGNTWEEALAMEHRKQKGIMFDKGRKKYRAYVYINGKQKFIGRYDTEEEAKRQRGNYIL